LEFDEQYVADLKCNSKGEIRNSATGLFRITGRILRAINNEINDQIDKANDNNAKSKKIRNEFVHYTCLERSHLVKKYKPKNLSVALQKGINFEPLKDKWKPDWLQYL
jgi:uncharacterized protein YlaI